MSVSEFLVPTAPRPPVFPHLLVTFPSPLSLNRRVSQERGVGHSRSSDQPSCTPTSQVVQRGSLTLLDPSPPRRRAPRDINRLACLLTVPRSWTTSVPLFPHLIPLAQPFTPIGLG